MINQLSNLDLQTFNWIFLKEIFIIDMELHFCIYEGLNGKSNQQIYAKFTTLVHNLITKLPENCFFALGDDA